MTGRELIIYILENKLENEPVFKNGKFIGFMTMNEVAVKTNVGPSTVGAWVALGELDYANVHGHIYIPATAIK